MVEVLEELNINEQLLELIRQGAQRAPPSGFGQQPNKQAGEYTE